MQTGWRASAARQPWPWHRVSRLLLLTHAIRLFTGACPSLLIVGQWTCTGTGHMFRECANARWGHGGPRPAPRAMAARERQGLRCRRDSRSGKKSASGRFFRSPCNLGSVRADGGFAAKAAALSHARRALVGRGAVRMEARQGKRKAVKEVRDVDPWLSYRVDHARRRAEPITWGSCGSTREAARSRGKWV